jgi:imidazolonepropionase-like amidohydrolase
MPSMPRVALALAATAAYLLLSACAERPATEPSPRAPAAATDVVAITGARVFDGSRDLGVVDIVVRDGRIDAIGTGIAIPDGARKVDHSGRFVIPGLVSAHSHVANTEGTEHGDRFYTRDNVIRDLRRFQAFGVTTVNALGLNGEAFHALRAEVAADPSLGAALLGAGAGIGVAGGAPPVAGMGLEQDVVARPASADEARQAVREQHARGIDIVKLWVDDLGGDAPQMAPEVYRAAIEQAHALGLRVSAHIHDLAPAGDLVASGVDVIAHGVRDRPVDREFVDAMLAHGTWYVATLQIDEADYLYADKPELLETPFLQAALPAVLRQQFEDPGWRERALASADESRAAVAMNLRNLSTLREAGVRIGFGTDSGALPQRVIGFAEHRELELMGRAGFAPPEALAAATHGSAELLGLEDRGLLAPGRRADFIVLEADPLADIRNTRSILSVWQAGREVSGPVTEARID